MARKHNGPCGPGPDDPTLDEIAAFCKALQAGWSKREEARRRGKLWYEEDGMVIPMCVMEPGIRILELGE